MSVGSTLILSFSNACIYIYVYICRQYTTEEGHRSVPKLWSFYYHIIGLKCHNYALYLRYVYIFVCANVCLLSSNNSKSGNISGWISTSSNNSGIGSSVRLKFISEYRNSRIHFILKQIILTLALQLGPLWESLLPR